MTRRDWLAFVLAPPLVAMLIVVALHFYDPSQYDQIYGFVAIATFTVVHPATLAFGVPFWFLCKTRWGVTWPRVLFGGAVFGALLPLFLGFMMLFGEFRENKSKYYLREQFFSSLEFAAQGALIGICIAVLIRTIAGKTSTVR